MDNKSFNSAYYYNYNSILAKINQIERFCVNLQKQLNFISEPKEYSTAYYDRNLKNQLIQLKRQTKQLDELLKRSKETALQMSSEVDELTKKQYDVELFYLNLNNIINNIEDIWLLKLSCEMQTIIIFDCKLNDSECYDHIFYISEKCLYNNLCNLNIILLSNEEVKYDYMINWQPYMNSPIHSNISFKVNSVKLQNNENHIFYITETKTSQNNLKKLKLDISLMIVFCIIGIIISILAAKFGFGFEPLVSIFIALCFLSLLITAVYSIFYCFKKIKRT